MKRQLSEPGLPSLRFKKVWKLHEVLNVRVTTGHGPAQAQEVPAEKGCSSRFHSQKFICKIKYKYWNFRVLAGCFMIKCEQIMVLGIYKKSLGKICSITKSLRSQTKVWRLVTLCRTTTEPKTLKKTWIQYSIHS